MHGDLTRLVSETAREHDFSGVVRVTDHREVAVFAAFGLADRTHGVANTTLTRFGTASGTKLLTALAVGALIDEGRLALGSLLGDVVSFDLSGVSDKVTVEHLLSHTSGVYDYYDEELIEDFDTFKLPIALSQLLRPSDYLPMVAGGEMKFPPGERFAYSNGGFVLLGMMIEELCGDYHRFVEERVMARAGMTASGFFRFDKLPELTATGYVETGSEWCSNTDVLPIIGGPDGGAFVTASDTERLWQAFLSFAILSPELTRAFARRVVTYKDAVHYGRGLWIRDDGDHPPTLYIEGSDAGVSFRSTCHGADIIATVASNTGGGAWPMARAIDLHISELLSPAKRRFAWEL